MFTGIIESTAKILQQSPSGPVIGRPKSFDDIKVGSSISVSGVCLSVTALTPSSMEFDVVPETLKKTTLGALKKGDVVNLERAMQLTDRFEGHVVQGHVEGVGTVISAFFLHPPVPLPLEEEGGVRRKKPTGSNILFFAREMRKKPTKAESVLWEALRYDQLGVRFRRQYPLGGRILDFYVPTINLAIEVDGDIHENPKVHVEDTVRDTYLQEEHGLRILRFTNDDVVSRLEDILKLIRVAIRNSPPPSEEGLGVEEGMLKLQLPAGLLRSIIPKGSIAIDGVSLTIAEIDGNQVAVALIPHTLKNTTLGTLKKGDQVNIETDVLVRSLHALSPPASHAY